MIELRLLGTLDLRRAEGEPLSGVLAQPKRLALLAYLVLAPERSFSRRDSIATLLWPDQDQEHARGSLRQAVHFLRREMGEPVIRNRGEEEIGLDGSLVWCDASAFRQAVAAARFDEAVALYAGILLPGFYVSDATPEFDQWLEHERNGLQTLAAGALWSASEGHRGSGDLDRAIALARQAVRLRPDDEAGMRRLLLLLDADGDRTGAIAAYEGFAHRVRAEHGVEPSAETQRLLARIRQRTLPHSQAEPGTLPEPAPLADAATARAGQAVRPGGRRWIPGLVFVLLLLAGLVLYSTRAGRVAQEHPERARTVAVLPVLALTGDTTEALVDAATDQLITDLAQIASLHVINRRTMMFYKDATSPLDSISRRLGAGLFLSSTLEQPGPGILFRVQLVTAEDPRIVWARTFTGDRRELPGWLLEVSRAVAEYTSVQLTATERAGLTARPKPTAVAFELYTKGRWWWNKGGRENLERAKALFTEALDADPTYASAYAGLADTYNKMGYGGFLSPDQAFPRAKMAAARALAQDSTNAEAHVSLAYARMYYDWDFPAAEREFRTAVRLNPSWATAHDEYSLYLLAMGRFAEAESEVETAVRLDPLSAPIVGEAGWVSHYSNRQDEAAARMKSALSLSPDDGGLHFQLGRVYQAQGKYSDALAEYDTAEARGFVTGIGAIGYVEGVLGHRPAARAMRVMLDSIRRMGRYVSPYVVALVPAGLGDKDSAFVWLNRAVADRTHWLLWLNRDPRWAPLRSDPRFASLVQRIGLPR